MARNKGLAISCDVTPRYCAADPCEGAKQAVAECWRNLTAVGADPLAITDCLNFGNPERPEIMGEFVERDRRHGRGLPRAVLPGRVGQCVALQRDQWRRHPAHARHRRHRADPRRHPHGDDRVQARRRRADPARARKRAISASRSIMQIDAGAERRARRRRSISTPSAAPATSSEGLIRGRTRLTAVHDVSDGGLLVAVAEMALAGGHGVELDAIAGPPARACDLVRRGPGALCRGGVPRRRRRHLARRRPVAKVPLRLLGKGGEAMPSKLDGEAPAAIGGP